ncbi:MAG: replicative DNA helicase, partial [Sphingomonadales bacterium]
MAQPIPFPTPEAPEGLQLPQNIEAEAALLGAMMIDNRVAEDVLQKLRPEHFFEPLHGRIYDMIATMVGDNRLATPVTLRPLFVNDAAMKELGGPAYLAQLTGNPASLIGARAFADQVYDLAVLRALVTVGRDLVDSALDTSEDINPAKQIEKAELKLYEVAETGGE